MFDLNSESLLGRHPWQSDGLCTGKERNRNVPVFGGLSAHFNVARRRFRDGNAGAAAIQRDILSVAIAQNGNRVSSFVRRIPIPNRQPQQTVLSTGNIFANLALGRHSKAADRLLDFVGFYLGCDDSLWQDAKSVRTIGRDWC